MVMAMWIGEKTKADILLRFFYIVDMKYHGILKWEKCNKNLINKVYDC